MVAKLRTTFIFVCVCLACVVCCGCLSCGHKDRSNPLDPSNPDTHGSPPGFAAVALDGRVELRWEALSLEGLVGLNVYRREAGLGAFQLLDGSPLPAEAGAAVDSTVTNGITYEYLLSPLIEGYGEGVASPVQTATPGPDFAVVCDGCDGIVAKLSADMRSRVWTAGGFFYPLSIAATAGRVWLADPYTGVYCLTGEGGLLWKSTDSAVPAYVAVSTSGLCAVVDAFAPEVRVLSADGATVLTLSEGLQKPSSVAFDDDGNLWLADRAAGFVRKYSADGQLAASFTGCVEPGLVETDAQEAACWVGDTSTGDLVKLDSQAVEVLRLPFSGSMTAVEADRSGGCWVADKEEDVVARVSGDGRVLFRIGKLGGPAAVFSAANGKTWVLGASESRVTVLSARGEILSAAAFGQCLTSLVVLGP